MSFSQNEPLPLSKQNPSLQLFEQQSASSSQGVVSAPQLPPLPV